MVLQVPRQPGGYNILFDCADANLLADCQIFLATHPDAQNQAYNVNNVTSSASVRCAPSICKVSIAHVSMQYPALHFHTVSPLGCKWSESLSMPALQDKCVTL